jgi:hypothetical protein
MLNSAALLLVTLALCTTSARGAVIDRACGWDTSHI